MNTVVMNIQNVSEKDRVWTTISFTSIKFNFIPANAKRFRVNCNMGEIFQLVIVFLVSCFLEILNTNIL